jgi:hypothetical protein
MAGPYFNFSGPMPIAPIGSAGCLSGGAGYINDDAAAACWAVHAAPVIIRNSWMSVHAGFSFVNMLYRSYGEQPAVSILAGLPGPLKGRA